MLGFVIGFMACYAAAGSILAFRSIPTSKRLFGKPWYAFVLLIFITWPVILFDVDV